MVGLPTETDEDLVAIRDLTLAIRERMLRYARPRGAVGRIVASVNPLIPKPGTAFQWMPMETAAATDAKVKRLLGIDDVNKAFDRDNGVRFLVSLVGEVALQQELSGYLILEGAPFEQRERALFNDLFSASMLGKDSRFYGHIGLTYKF
jgi:hypothetical protein